MFAFCILPWCNFVLPSLHCPMFSYAESWRTRFPFHIFFRCRGTYFWNLHFASVISFSVCCGIRLRPVCWCAILELTVVAELLNTHCLLVSFWGRPHALGVWWWCNRYRCFVLWVRPRWSPSYVCLLSSEACGIYCLRVVTLTIARVVSRRQKNKKKAKQTKSGVLRSFTTSFLARLNHSCLRNV
jgi:hypothetical protein